MVGAEVPPNQLAAAKQQSRRVNSAKPTALQVSRALGRLLPLPDHPELDHLRSLVMIAYEEACELAYRSEPTEKDLEYIRYLEREAKAFAKPVGSPKES